MISLSLLESGEFPSLTNLTSAIGKHCSLTDSPCSYVHGVMYGEIYQDTSVQDVVVTLV